MSTNNRMQLNHTPLNANEMIAWMASGKPEKAISVYTSSLTYVPPITNIGPTVSLAYLLAGDTRNFETSLDQVRVEKDKDLLIGLARLLGGKTGDAISCFRQIYKRANTSNSSIEDSLESDLKGRGWDMIPRIHALRVL